MGVHLPVEGWMDARIGQITFLLSLIRSSCPEKLFTELSNITYIDEKIKKYILGVQLNFWSLHLINYSIYSN